MFFDKSKFDKQAFEKELTDLAKQTREEECSDDMSHLCQIVSLTNMFGLLGLMTCWYSQLVLFQLYVSAHTHSPNGRLLVITLVMADTIKLGREHNTIASFTGWGGDDLLIGLIGFYPKHGI